MFHVSRFVRYWLPILAWMGLIFYFSSIPSLESGFANTTDWVLRKGAHVFVYAVLTTLAYRAFRQGCSMKIKDWELPRLRSYIFGARSEVQKNTFTLHSTRWKIKTALWGAVVLALLYALSDEFHQRFVAGRHGRLRDVAVDAIGIAIAIAVLSRSRR